jgi:hypothetical protein
MKNNSLFRVISEILQSFASSSPERWGANDCGARHDGARSGGAAAWFLEVGEVPAGLKGQGLGLGGIGPNADFSGNRRKRRQVAQGDGPN